MIVNRVIVILEIFFNKTWSEPMILVIMISKVLFVRKHKRRLGDFFAKSQFAIPSCAFSLFDSIQAQNHEQDFVLCILFGGYTHLFSLCRLLLALTIPNAKKSRVYVKSGFYLVFGISIKDPRVICFHDEVLSKQQNPKCGACAQQNIKMSSLKSL